MTISFVFTNPFQKIAFEQKIKMYNLLCCLYRKAWEIQEILVC